MRPMAAVYIAITLAAGLAISVFGAAGWESHDLIRYLCYLLVALLASSLKVTLPGITGTMSVNYIFILVGVMELTFPETLFLGCLATLTQTVWRPKSRPSGIQILFNVASMAIAIWVAYSAYHSALGVLLGRSVPLTLGVTACLFFVTNTFSIAVVVGLTEKRPLVQVWKECYFWSFPYYLLGASTAGLVNALNRLVGWQTSLLALPIVYIVYRSYRLYLGRLEDQTKHAEEMASLHLRTIEALALAIEAKDETTHNHLQRVQSYAVEIGKELGLSEPELQALHASALLHDIGKLAVPEHIISKPGKLTPEEFEKMKIHPVVGAELLERVQFPYPVAPIVRAHHEKWDGTGYPDGLRGEEIPIGARILSVVDCLDALASDRQYRRALPLEQAMKVVVSEAGKSFDPRVVRILRRRHVELEALAILQPNGRTRLATNLKIDRGAAPAAGFEHSAESPADSGSQGSRLEFLSSIAAARQEVQMLFELSQDLGTSLSLHETLSVLDIRLKRLIPYDASAIYVVKENRLVPEYVQGENFRLFSSLEIPLGEGLSGWVASNGKPIVNGNPSVEPGYLNDNKKFSTLRSALAVPLEGVNGVLGVLTLYHASKDAFSRDHLRILLAISSKISLAVENALKYRQVEISAITDGLTGLPNARSLFLHLDAELSRSRRSNTALAVLVCDLDGFKQVNDRYGHLAGNRLLKMVAVAMKQCCREYDYVARMGGDEFVLVLPGIKPEAVAAKVAALARVVEEVGTHVCGDKTIAISIGEAFYPGNGADAEELLADADRRMYKAKQERKARLQAAQPTAVPGM